MSRTGIAAAAAAAVLLGSASSVHAQENVFSVEGRAGLTSPTGDFSDAGAESGLALGVDLMYTFQPALTIYGGFGRDAFDCEGCADDATSTGFDLGLKALLPREGGILPWVKGGVIFHELEFDDEQSDREAGLQLGAGLDVPLSPSFAVTPAIRYQNYGASLPGDGDPDSVDVTYLAFELGAHFHFHLR